MATFAARFAGHCRNCSGTIEVGEVIVWERGRGSWHSTAAGCAAARARRAAQPAAPAVRQDAAPIAAFLKAAKDRGLRFPKARFLAPDGRGEILLSLATERSRTPGAVFVKLNGEYLGLVAPDGTVRGLLARRDDIRATLAAIAANPADAAQRYGRLHCRCSFCSLPLSDAGSVEVGYGPICAEHWGLPHRPQGTPALRPVGAVPPAAGGGSLRELVAEMHADAYTDAADPLAGL